MPKPELPSADGHLSSTAPQEQLRPAELTLKHIFSNGNGFLLTTLGSRLQGIFLDMQFLNSDDPPDPQGVKGIRDRIKRICVVLGIPDDDVSLRQLGLKFYELVRQRHEEAGERSRLVLTET